MGIYLYTARRACRNVIVDGDMVKAYQYQFACKVYGFNERFQQSFINRSWNSVPCDLLEKEIFVFGDFCEGASAYRAAPGHCLPRAVYDDTMSYGIKKDEIEFLGHLVIAGNKGRGYRYALNRKPAFFRKLATPAKPYEALPEW